MATPNFDAPIANPFGLRNIQGLTPPLNAYAADPVFVDIDNDGDLDAFIGSDINNDSGSRTFYFQNTGTASAPSFAAPLTNPFGLGFSRGYNSPEFADIDGDGDFDAFIGDSDGNTLFFRNTGTAAAPTFTAATSPFGDVGAYSKPTFADIDGDGDLDAFIGEEYGNTRYFQNTGTRTAPSFAAPVTNPFGLNDVNPAPFTFDNASPTFADVDGDGDLDAFVGAFNGNTFFFQNTGTRTAPSFAAPVTNPFGLSDVGNNSNPTFADIDNDGDLDAFVGELFGDTRFFENNANDARLSVAPGNNAAEPSTPGSFTLTLSRPAPAGGLTVSYTVGGTATNGTDYTTLPGSVTFAAGATTATVTVTPIADALAEGNETVILTPIDRSGYTLGTNTTATITLTDPVNQPPTAVNDTATTNEDTPVTINVLANDTDPNSDPLSLSSFTNPTNGTITRNDNGTPANLTDDRLIYTPNANYSGSDSFTYTISDGKGGTSTATVNLTVQAVNKAPTAVNLINSITSLAENTPTPNPIKLADLTVTDDNLGSNSLSLSGADATAFEIQNNALYLKAGTALDYETKSAYKVTVNVDDPTVGNTPDASTNFTLNLTNVNEAPTAVNDSISAYKNTPKTIAAATLLANDTDPDAGTTLKITGVSNATNGNVSLNSSGDVVFTPTKIGNASFQYTASDGSLTSTATVAVSVGLNLNGGNGIDVLLGSDYDDLLNGNDGADGLYGNKGNDILNGGKGIDLLLGGQGNDILNGGDNADALYGGKGNDTLNGGAGIDIFYFAVGDGSDTIQDFSDRTDKIGLTGGLRFGQLTISSSGSNTLIKFGSETLATLTGVNSSLITSADFVTI
ncbi:Ig-like domain-containing protein [Nostoc sp.]|uniref:Ig-like domain-containing protein n=1 Tax=Nostoc sp. TaxID=1180 RepID=UPI003FA573B7